MNEAVENLNEVIQKATWKASPKRTQHISNRVKKKITQRRLCKTVELKSLLLQIKN